MADFDIENYNVEELVNILGLGSEIPLTNDKIVSTIKIFTDKFKTRFEEKQITEENKTMFIKFFNDIREKLLINKKDETIRDLYDEEISVEGMTRKAIPVNSREPRKAILYDKDIMGDTRITGMQNVNQSPFDNVTTDYKNPLLRNTAKTLVTIDSAYRTIIQETDCSGNIIEDGKKTKSQTASNFTVNLSLPIKNVLEITFASASIPNKWYTFASDYGTNYFIEKRVDVDTYTDISNVFITSGNYNAEPGPINIIDELNSKTNRITFTHNPISNKVTIKNNMNYKIKIDWYSLSIPLCSTSGNGGKIDYNLGWLLGFRSINNILEASDSPGDSEEASSTLNTTGSTYLYISVDDFNNNKPNQDLVSFQNNVVAFNMPSYYVKTTMCSDADLTNTAYTNPSNLFCGKKYNNKDLSSNLTSKQRYTIDQIKLAMQSKKSERYSSPNSPDILTKINVNLTGDYTQVEEVNLEYKKRFYFGPINLKKLHIRLLNDKGMDINLNDNDWSFSFYVTTVYQV